MSQPSPFIPQGSFLEQRQAKRRFGVRTAVFVILAFHVVLLTGLLIQGRERDEQRAETSLSESVNKLPAPARNPLPRTTTPDHSPNTYVVKSGDTLARIANAHGTTIQALHALNRLKTDQIVVGQKLKLPETGAAAVSGSRNSSSQP